MMRQMKKREADQLGAQIAALIEEEDFNQASGILEPHLGQRIPFSSLDRIGKAMGMASYEKVISFLARVARNASEGSWPVIGSALAEQMGHDRSEVFQHCRALIIQADVWYATDTLAERVPGPALVIDFLSSLELLHPWVEEENRWVRRALGVAVHFWAKRSRGAVEFEWRARSLLDLLAPLFEEREMDAVKGIGWGLKTLGRYYPDLMTAWLHIQISQKARPHRALMLRKALTFLSLEQRITIQGENA